MPRRMEFLYSLNRLNVATSRGGCATFIVASPALLEPQCRTPKHMQLANGFCQFVGSMGEPVNDCKAIGRLAGGNDCARVWRVSLGKAHVSACAGSGRVRKTDRSSGAVHLSQVAGGSHRPTREEKNQHAQGDDHSIRSDMLILSAVTRRFAYS
jgi:hypothetical protein